MEREDERSGGQNVRALVVWQRAADLVIDVYRATKAWPKDELYGLTNQVRRAAVSVPANVAEGQGRNSPNEFLHHLGTANGSLCELETHLIIAQRLGYLNSHALTALTDRSTQVARPFNGLMRSLRSPTKPARDDPSFQQPETKGAHLDVTLRIKRYNPDLDVKPHFEEYAVDVEPTDRVLDALNQIKWYQDGTLTYRRSCAHGVCGSDAMRINGRNRLACKILMQELGKKITIEPLIGFRIVKDLVVDMDQFFDSYKSVKPYLIADEAAAGQERRQSPEQRERFDDTTKCILCAACTSSCPITWTNEEYVGPAAIVNAHRFIFDSRDQGGAERLRILNTRSGVWRCRTIFNCTDACPRGIKVTSAIEQVKRALLYE